MQYRQGLKFQIPNPKFQIPNNVWYLMLGIWNLNKRSYFHMKNT